MGFTIFVGPCILSDKVVSTPMICCIIINNWISKRLSDRHRECGIIQFCTGRQCRVFIRYHRSVECNAGGGLGCIREFCCFDSYFNCLAMIRFCKCVV